MIDNLTKPIVLVFNSTTKKALDELNNVETNQQHKNK